MPLFALRVVEHLDVFKDGLPCGFAGLIAGAADAFPLEELEVAFRDSIVVAVASAAHAGIQIVLASLFTATSRY